MKIQFFIAIGLLLALLPACQNIETLKQGISEKFSAGGRDKTYLAELQAAENSNSGICGGDGQDAVSIARVDIGLGLVNAPKLSSYVNQVLANIVKVSPQPDCQATVFILPNNDVNTIATKYGGILLPMGLLRTITTEDELAAILAHEYSHILYKHHNSDVLEKTQDSLLSGMNTILAAETILAYVQHSKQGQKLETGAKLTENIFLLSEAIIIPSWSRKQEDDADLLGTDLLVAAGYNPSAMSKIMDILATQENAIAEQKALRKQLSQEKFQNNAFDLAGRSAPTRLSNSNQQAAEYESLWNTISTGVTVAPDTVGEDHRSAAQRKSQLQEYVRTFHGKQHREYQQAAYEKTLSGGTVATIMASYKAASAARTALAKGDKKNAEVAARKAISSSVTRQHAYPRLAFYELRKKQGFPNKAKKNLDYALQRKDAPWSIHRNMIQLHLDRHANRKALRALQTAVRSLHDPLPILPFRIAVYKATGKNKLLAQSLARCRAEGIPALKKSCSFAAGPPQPQPQAMVGQSPMEASQSQAETNRSQAEDIERRIREFTRHQQ